MDQLEWLTPAQARLPAWPRWVRVPLAAALGLTVAGTLIGSEPLASLGGLLAGLTALRVGWWLEELVYGSLGARRARVKVFVHLLLSGAGLPAIIAVIFLAKLPFGVGTFVAAFGPVVVWWVSAASAGTAMIITIDALVSRWQARFRTRLTLAILGLLGGALTLAMIASWLSSSMVAAFVSHSPNVNTTGLGEYSAEQVRAFIEGHPGWVSLGVFLMVFSIALPAVVSACAKLADAAMERLRPMSRAFQAVSEGRRNVRVEEQGSVEFIELARTFNRLVESLTVSEKMERAFGRYVSGQVLSRIRAQHGEAELPASLREATVFFADIRGFTALSERLSPEQVVSFLNRYLARVVSRIDEHLGYLNKFIGDAVVVVFNGPVDQPDHAERAVRCALALQDEVAKLNASGAMPEVGELKIGIGIATGPMVSGNVGGPTQMEYTVIGDTVNLSARLTSLAGPGEVWVSQATAKAAPNLRFTPLPEVKVKGKEKPVAVQRAEPLQASSPVSTLES